jgi:hypothetical protein
LYALAIFKIGFYLDRPLLLTLNTAVCKVISNRFAFRVTAVTLDGELDRKGENISKPFLDNIINSKTDEDPRRRKPKTVLQI